MEQFYQDEQSLQHMSYEVDSPASLPEVTNAPPMPSKRQVATAGGQQLRGTPTSAQDAEMAFPQDVPAPQPRSRAGAQPQGVAQSPDAQALMTRWYQLVGEMQCLMAQMTALGVQPPAPFATGMAANPTPAPTSAPAPAVRSVGVTKQPMQSPAFGPAPGESGRMTPPAEPEHAPTVRVGRQANRHIPDSEPAPFVALVEFKRQRIRRYEATLFVKPGEYVVVDGDRGTDCGFVVQCAVRNSDGTYGRTESIDNTPIDPSRVKSEVGRIHRVATQDEIALLHGEIASMERYALKTCRDRVAAMGLLMEIVDCEFQFDRKKVTFFFDSQESIDFRELTKDLYRVFGSRIWLENINSKVKNVVPDGALSHADKVIYAQRGLRAPRR